MYKLTKIGADLAPLPDDTEGHVAVRVERDLLSRQIIVANASPPKPVNWAEAKAWAESLTLNGWAWRLATVEEAFLVCDHNRKNGVLDPAFFNQVKLGWAWTSTPDPDTACLARGVYLRDGFSDCDEPVYLNQALAVLASQ